MALKKRYIIITAIVACTANTGFCQWTNPAPESSDPIESTNDKIVHVRSFDGGLRIVNRGSYNFLHVGGHDLATGKGFAFKSTTDNTASKQLSLSITNGSAQEERLSIHRFGSMYLRATDGGFFIQNSGTYNYLQVGGADITTGKGFVFRSTTDNTTMRQLTLFVTDGSHQRERLSVTKNGDVGIGTMLSSNPNGYKLAVKGKIGAQEVQVESTSSTWADYVFEPDYDLMPLEKVEVFVKENKHLPEIPSKTEVEQNGHKLGEMDVLLLKKVEELTLYVIELKKIISQQAQEIEKLKSNK